MNILITEKKDYSKKAIRMYASLGRVYFWEDLKSEKEKSAVLAKTHILVVRLRHAINASWMKKMPELKVIATNTTGLNHIDGEEARRRNVKIVSLRGHTSFLKHIPSTAEKTMALMLALMRNLPWAFDHVKKGGWDRDQFKGNQLYKKTLGIIGFGRLGKIVARYAKAFRMNVIAYDPHISRASFGKIKKVSLDELCKYADIISLHASFDPEHPQIIIGEKQLKDMKHKTPYIINTARGELIDEKALLHALRGKWIRGAALDVLANEQGNGGHLKKNPLLSYAKKNKNLIIVPHLGGATYEAMQITEEFIANIVKKYFEKRK